MVWRMPDSENPAYPTASREHVMTQTIDRAETIRNGVDTATMFATLDAVKAQPEIASFRFRAHNQWIGGAHNRSTIHDFYAACAEDTSRQSAFALDAGEPAILLGTDTGPNPAEYLLHALAACVTTSLVYVAAARRVKAPQVLVRSRYRHPAQLPDGGVLVVGAGPTGQQIADELAITGRRVHLAVGRHRVLPRRYRGRDAFWWLDRTGASRRTVDELVRRPVRAESSVLAGGRDLDLRVVVSHGVVPHGRLVGVDGTRAVFADDLASSMAAGEEHARRFRERVDRYVARTGLRVPEDVAPAADMPHWACEPSTELELDRGRISAVIWATGYLRDYSWLHAPVLDAAGNPVQRRGVTSAPGLFFLGLSFQWRRDSSFIDGVGADAEHLADHIVGLDARAAA